MDMQTYILPVDFHDEVLSTIRITDNRTSWPSSPPHSGIVQGVTVSAVPIPAAVWLFGGGLGLLGFLRKKAGKA